MSGHHVHMDRDRITLTVTSTDRAAIQRIINLGAATTAREAISRAIASYADDLSSELVVVDVVDASSVAAHDERIAGLWLGDQITVDKTGLALGDALRDLLREHDRDLILGGRIQILRRDRKEEVS